MSIAISSQLRPNRAFSGDNPQKGTIQRMNAWVLNNTLGRIFGFTQNAVDTYVSSNQKLIREMTDASLKGTGLIALGVLLLLIGERLPSKVQFLKSITTLPALAAAVCGLLYPAFKLPSMAKQSLNNLATLWQSRPKNT